MARPSTVIMARAFAKINVALRVVGTRPDGYHELQTVYQSLALHDRLRFTRARGAFRLTCDDPACPLDRRNLVWRAAEAVWRASGRRGAVRDLAVHVEKRIPMQAGLGGGSSDAAATLRATALLWRVPADRLPALAAPLGADVPYFLCGGTALGVERGDVVFPLADAPARWVVLVVPSFGIATDEAYRWWDLRPSRLARVDRPGTNDLQAPVSRRHPEIGRLAAALARAGGSPAAMSGSGSTVFGMFEREAAARAACRRLQGPGRRTLVTTTIGRARSVGTTALRRRTCRT